MKTSFDCSSDRLDYDLGHWQYYCHEYINTKSIEVEQSAVQVCHAIREPTAEPPILPSLEYLRFPDATLIHKDKESYKQPIQPYVPIRKRQGL